MNKRKIINDPVHGFIQIPSDLVYDIINHRFFQRLRRINQLGLASFVYPGALHTRFHHAIGAMHLMGIALDILRSKGIEISKSETESAQIAILLHDIGHGPMSHVLESTILNDVPHESISTLLMMKLNEEFGGALSDCIKMFNGQYPRYFFHQLISSQLDIDRMDYLQRDCFFTGVSEGTIGASRILKMLNVVNDHLVVEEKGIYSIENFLTARRLMYWQVYLHKTNVAADQMLIQLLERARFLLKTGEEITSTEALSYFLTHDIKLKDFQKDGLILENFNLLDDYDIWSAIKQWQNHPDKVLRLLSKSLLERNLFRIQIRNQPFEKSDIKVNKDFLKKQLNLVKEEWKYFVLKGILSNEAYLKAGDKINILTKKGEILDIAHASDLPNIKALRKIVKKYFMAWYRL